MTLASVIDAAEGRRRTLYHYGVDDSELAQRFATRNVAVETRSLPPGGPREFVVIREADEFRGAVALSDLESFLDPPLREPWELDELSPGYRALVDLLSDTVFGSLDRRQLLATSREFEDRAWRVGRGTLRVGFQSVRALRAQAPVYRRLAAETDLDVHVYAAPDDEADVSLEGVTLHAGPSTEIGRYWFLVFDGGGDPDQRFALVAEERETDRFYGVWSADEAFVEAAREAVADLDEG